MNTQPRWYKYEVSPDKFHYVYAMPWKYQAWLENGLSVEPCERPAWVAVNPIPSGFGYDTDPNTGEK